MDKTKVYNLPNACPKLRITDLPDSAVQLIYANTKGLEEINTVFNNSSWKFNPQIFTSAIIEKAELMFIFKYLSNILMTSKNEEKIKHIYSILKENNFVFNNTADDLAPGYTKYELNEFIKINLANIYKKYNTKLLADDTSMIYEITFDLDLSAITYREDEDKNPTMYSDIELYTYYFQVFQILNTIEEFNQLCDSDKRLVKKFIYMNTSFKD